VIGSWYVRAEIIDDLARSAALARGVLLMAPPKQCRRLWTATARAGQLTEIRSAVHPSAARSRHETIWQEEEAHDRPDDS
jgi:hypothetical protein